MKKILVPISGGKDSQCCLKLAKQLNPDAQIEGLYCDTQWEHPLTYAHIDKISQLYNVKIHKVTGGSVPEKVLKYNRFPVLNQRFCTEELKMRETRIFLKEYGKCQVWYGMRSEESHKRKVRYEKVLDTEEYEPHVLFRKYPKYLAKLGIRFVLPILSWSSEDVLDFLDGEENPLYKQGFDRVGCFPCLAASDKQKIKCFEHDDFGKSQKQKVIMLENITGKSVFLRKENQNNNVCTICTI